MTQELQIERDGRVLHLSLNREEKRNALSGALCHALIDAVEAAQLDPSVGCILLDAKGPVFCAGMDLDEATQPEAVALTAVHQHLFTLGLRSNVPIVIAVQGPALGGGVGLLACGHIVIAAQGVNLALSEIRIGMWPYFISRALIHAMGERRTLALSLTGRVFSAREAQEFGIVHEIAPAMELEDRAIATAQHVASLSSEAIRRGMEFFRQARTLDDEAALQLAAQARERNFNSADFHEGVAAFREKRTPVWPSQS